ncbi:rubredoxin [Magnetofaba australis]|uniref:rubredoxin n=1 Tax=Magnetofaba australis TaxID=1472297 RepID=UPI000A19FA38|nr:rubredoxin [Magnetofaba australis]
MTVWYCLSCDYTYDSEQGSSSVGAPPGTAFDALPDDWRCPLCGMSKEHFLKEGAACPNELPELQWDDSEDEPVDLQEADEGETNALLALRDDEKEE